MRIGAAAKRESLTARERTTTMETNEVSKHIAGCKECWKQRGNCDVARELERLFRPYYTVFVPFVPADLRTEWHPTDEIGPFSILNRGAFKTFQDAVLWARARLNGTPYTVKLINP
jgi:hypothetical protein